jgi:hypothetical protein
MKKLFSNTMFAGLFSLTILLLSAAGGYAFNNVPIKYVIVFGILWQIQMFILILWEESC